MLVHKILLWCVEEEEREKERKGRRIHVEEWHGVGGQHCYVLFCLLFFFYIKDIERSFMHKYTGAHRHKE